MSYFSVCGFKGYTQITCIDGNGVFFEREEDYIHRNKSEMYEHGEKLRFEGFGKKGNTCQFRNVTFHGVSGGALCIRKQIVGVHSCGNPLNEIQGGTMIDKVAWDW